MKRYLIILLYAFMLLFSTCALAKTTDTNAKTKIINEKEVVEEKNKSIKEEYDNTEKEKQEKLEEEQLEEENNTTVTENTDTIQTTATNEPVQNNSPTIENNYVNYGTFGRLYVSGYSVALYDYNVNTNSSSSLQTIVNNADSAAYYKNYNKLVIADHNYQGFNVLAYLTEGATSYIKFENGSAIQYRLIKKSKGYNTGPDLVDTEGNSFFNMNSDIIMYTCYEDGIMVTLWSLS